MGFFDGGNNNQEQQQQETGEYLKPGYMYVFFLKDSRKVLVELVSIEDVNGPGMFGMLNKKIVGYKVYRRFKEKIPDGKGGVKERSITCRSYIKEEEVTEILFAHQHYPNTFSGVMKQPARRPPMVEPEGAEYGGEF